MAKPKKIEFRILPDPIIECNCIVGVDVNGTVFPDLELFIGRLTSHDVDLYSLIYKSVVPFKVRRSYKKDVWLAKMFKRCSICGELIDWDYLIEKVERAFPEHKGTYKRARKAVQNWK